MKRRIPNSKVEEEVTNSPVVKTEEEVVNSTVVENEESIVIASESETDQTPICESNRRRQSKLLFQEWLDSRKKRGPKPPRWKAFTRKRH